MQEEKIEMQFREGVVAFDALRYVSCKLWTFGAPRLLVWLEVHGLAPPKDRLTGPVGGLASWSRAGVLLPQ